MTVSSLLALFWRQRLVFGVLVLLTLMSTAAFLASAQKIYTATASVGVFPADDAQEDYSAIIEPLLGTLVEEAAGEENLRDALRNIPNAPSLGALSDNVSATPVPVTFLLRISVDNPDPVLAAQLANAVAEALPNRGLFEGTVTYQSVTRANPPGSPSEPNTRIVAALGLMLALGLGAAGALLVDNRRRRIEDTATLEATTGAPVLAQLRRPSGVSTVQELVEHQGSGVRDLRVALIAVGLPHLLVVTSATDLPGGRNDTWVAEALARSIAQLDRRVLLVRAHEQDGDALPAGSAQGKGKSKSKSSGTPLRTGLTEVLSGTPVREAVHSKAGTDVLEVGRAPGRLADLLETSYAGVRTRLGDGYDTVIVDAPPLSSSQHAQVLVAEGSVLLTGQLGALADRPVRLVTSRLDAARSTLLGVAVVARPPVSLLRRIVGR